MDTKVQKGVLQKSKGFEIYSIIKKEENQTNNSYELIWALIVIRNYKQNLL
jgi:hypothetical protein